MLFVNIKHWLIIVFNIFCAIFNNSPHSIYVNNCCIVSFDVIRPLGGICDKQVLTESFKEPRNYVLRIARAWSLFFHYEFI